MIEYVTLSNVQKFSGNPLVAQHELRYKSIIERQGWEVPCFENMEFDQYDNPAAKYLVYRDEDGVARGLSRFYPTTLPYMLEEKFSYFVTAQEIPKSDRIWEGSRFCVDHTLPAEVRNEIIDKLVIGYVEAGLHFNIEAIVGLMYPAYWRGLFIRRGWDIKYMGDVTVIEGDGNRARSAWLPVNTDVLEKVRSVTGIKNSIVNFGEMNERKKAA